MLCFDQEEKTIDFHPKNQEHPGLEELGAGSGQFWHSTSESLHVGGVIHLSFLHKQLDWNMVKLIDGSSAFAVSLIYSP